jgi:hypothetical protein
MAHFHEVNMSTRRAALESFARSFGKYPPRPPIPEWWEAFEEWFATKGAKGTQQDRDAFKFLRTERYEYVDENEDEE